MNQTDKAEFKDFIFQGIQAGKQETSRLISDLKNAFLGTIRDEIKVTVNGKIDGVKEHLNNQDQMLKEIKQEQTKVREDLANTTKDIAVSKAQIWTTIGLAIFFLGTIITLALYIYHTDQANLAEKIISTLEEKYNLQIK